MLKAGFLAFEFEVNLNRLVGLEVSNGRRAFVVPIFYLDKITHDQFNPQNTKN